MFRHGPEISESADLQPYLTDLEDNINIGYTYIEENSCTLNEGGGDMLEVLDVVKYDVLLRNIRSVSVRLSTSTGTDY